MNSPSSYQGQGKEKGLMLLNKILRSDTRKDFCRGLLKRSWGPWKASKYFHSEETLQTFSFFLPLLLLLLASVECLFPNKISDVIPPICSLIQEILSTYYVPDTVLGWRHSGKQKTPQSSGLVTGCRSGWKVGFSEPPPLALLCGAPALCKALWKSLSYRLLQRGQRRRP